MTTSFSIIPIRDLEKNGGKLLGVMIMDNDNHEMLLLDVGQIQPLSDGLAVLSAEHIKQSRCAK